MEGREGGGGSWETTPSRPLHPDGGDKGGNNRASAGGHRREQPGGMGRGKGYPKASPLRARHARPPFPFGPLPEQLSSERPKTLGPAEPLVTLLRSPRSRHGSCAGAGDAGHVAVLQPPPHALAAPPTRPAAARGLPLPRAGGGAGARGGGREVGRALGRGASPPWSPAPCSGRSARA